jgi:hypothetical protein
MLPLAAARRAARLAALPRAHAPAFAAAVAAALAPTSRRARPSTSSSSPPPPPPPAAAAPSGVAAAAARALALAREYGPAGAAVWTALYVLPGAGLFAALRAHDNFGLDLAAATAALPDVMQAWAAAVLASGQAALGLADAAALQPWHTSAALAWLGTELAEPLRLAATLLIVRAWRARRAAAALAAATQRDAATPPAAAEAGDSDAAAARARAQP